MAVYPLINYSLPMQQPDRNTEGYAIFVRCCDLSVETSASEFVATIEALDRILFGQIGENNEDFFPNPYGGAIHRSIDQTLGSRSRAGQRPRRTWNFSRHRHRLGPISAHHKRA